MKESKMQNCLSECIPFEFSRKDLTKNSHQVEFDIIVLNDKKTQTQSHTIRYGTSEEDKDISNIKEKPVYKKFFNPSTRKLNEEIAVELQNYYFQEIKLRAKNEVLCDQDQKYNIRDHKLKDKERDNSTYKDLIKTKLNVSTLENELRQLKEIEQQIQKIRYSNSAILERYSDRSNLEKFYVMLEEFQNLCILIDKNLLDLIQIKKTSCEESHLHDLEKTKNCFESLNVDNQNLLSKLNTYKNLLELYSIIELNVETDKKLKAKLDEKLSKTLNKELNERFDKKLNETSIQYTNNLEKEPEKPEEIYNVKSSNESSIEIIDDTEYTHIINECIVLLIFVLFFYFFVM